MGSRSLADAAIRESAEGSLIVDVEGSVRPGICGEETGESENCMGGNGMLSKAAEEVAVLGLLSALGIDIGLIVPTDCIAIRRRLGVPV